MVWEEGLTLSGCPMAGSAVVSSGRCVCVCGCVCVCVCACPLFLRGLRSFCLFLGVGRHLNECPGRQKSCWQMAFLMRIAGRMNNYRAYVKPKLLFSPFSCLGARLRSFDVFHQVCTGTASEPVVNLSGHSICLMHRPFLPTCTD